MLSKELLTVVQLAPFSAVTCTDEFAAVNPPADPPVAPELRRELRGTHGRTVDRLTADKRTQRVKMEFSSPESCKQGDSGRMFSPHTSAPVLPQVQVLGRWSGVEESAGNTTTVVWSEGSASESGEQHLQETPPFPISVRPRRPDVPGRVRYMSTAALAATSSNTHRGHLVFPHSQLTLSRFFSLEASSATRYPLRRFPPLAWLVFYWLQLTDYLSWQFLLVGRANLLSWN